MTTDDLEKLQAIVLPWAKYHHPDKYDATLKVANTPAYPKYLARLLEIRWQEDMARPWRWDVPLAALEETRIRQRLNWRGTEVEVCGRLVDGRVWSFAELAMLLGAYDQQAEFERLLKTKTALDLAVVEVGPCPSP